MAIEVRLCDEDRARFGGPEMLVLDWTAFADMTEPQLTALEEAMGMSVHEAQIFMARGYGAGMKAAAWLARQLTGDDELRKIGWKAFDIKPRKARFGTIGGASADPPADSSPSTEPDGEKDSKHSTASPAAARPLKSSPS